MTALRRVLRRYQSLALLLVLAAVALRVVVPAGFMPVATPDGTITVRICADAGMTPTAMTIAIPGLKSDGRDGVKHGKAAEPCAFAGLAMPSLGGADPLILALALAFILAVVFHVVPGAGHCEIAHLRPPLRGPPATS